jgi:hypothetical protein
VESEAFTADPSYRLRIDDELATYGMFYEGVVVTGATPFDLHEWHKRGYYADWQAPSVLEGHFVPCPLDVKLSGLAPGARPLVDVGVGGQMIFRDEPGELHTGDRESHVLLPRAPCGDVEVRPHWEDRGSDGVPRRRTCANASADGRIRATLQWDSAKVLCDAE